MIERGDPLFAQKNTSRSQEIDTCFSRDSKNSNLEENADHDRTRRPVVCTQPVGSSSMFNEPHSVVKQTEKFRVRELVKKMESHPHRQDIQADLQQNKAYNPFSEKSKKMIKDMGNVELFELSETNPKTQCKEGFFSVIKASFTALAGIS